MWIFTREKVVVDVLQEWRKIEIGGGFHMFDKVLCTKYWKKLWVITSKIDSGWDVRMMGINWLYFYTNLRDCKPYYWEFQKEFEALDESKKKMEEVEELSKKLVKAQQEAEELYKVGKKIVELNVSKQFIL